MSRFAYARTKDAGIAVDRLLKASGLTRQQLADPAASISATDQIRFLNLAAAALKDDLIGFHIAELPELRAVGLLYCLLASSETLLEGLQSIARYSAIVHEGIVQTCAHGGELSISIQYKGVGR